jgi:hypothetical protein
MAAPDARPDSAVAEAVAVAVVVTAAVVLALAAWVAPPVARTLLPHATWVPLPTVRKLVVPEPLEQLRFLIALGAAVAVGPVAVVVWRRAPGRTSVGGAALVVAQVLGLVLVVVCWRAQAGQHRWFSDRALVAAAVLAGSVLVAAWKGRLAAVFALTTAPRRRVRWVAGLLVAAAVTGLWLLPGIYRQSNISGADVIVRYHVQFTMNEFFAVVDGRSPLVNFAAQYTRLLPYVVAPVIALFGSSVGVFTTVMWVMGLASFLAVYLLFAEVTHDPVRAWALYLPFIAVSMSTVLRVADERVYLANLYGFVPLRLFGPFVLAWPVARQLRRPGRRAPVVLFALATLVALNNFELGLPCAAATFAALACGIGPELRRGVARLGAQAATGAAIAGALVSVVALVQTGHLPQLRYLTHFTRAFGVEGFGMLPMPNLGLHLLIYLTFVACVTVALVTGATHDPSRPTDAVMRGALAYAGVLGLGGFAYWVGRSDPLALVGVFPTWGLAAALLAWWTLRAVAARPHLDGLAAARVAVPAMVVLTVVGLMALSARQFPAPWSEVRRIGASDAARVDGTSNSYWSIVPRAEGGPTEPCPLGPPSLDHEAAVRFVAAHTHRGERVAIVASLGHDIARKTGVVNVSPYSHPDSIVFYEMIDFLVDAADQGDAHTLILGTAYPEIPTELRRRGFTPGDHDPVSGLTVWSRAA